MAAPDYRAMRVYIDGEIVSGDQARVSVFDHGLLYGDGVFEGIRAYDGLIFRCSQHIERLYDSAKSIDLTIPLTPGEMVDAMCRTIRATELRDAYIRLIVTRGIGDLGLDPRKCPRPSIIIIVGGITLYPPEFYEKGLPVVTTSTRRCRPDSLPPAVKSLNYLNSILARIEVNRQGSQEGIMLSSEGYVAECTADNLFIVKGGGLLTPAPHCGLLVGITRNAVLALARARGIPTRECVLLLQDVYNADECFLTGTAAEVAPVVTVDGRQIGDGRPGPITASLREALIELTRTDGHPVYP
jgi:branched-chain amino acid aminotransferase